MRTQMAVAANVIRFPGPRASSPDTRQKGLLDTIYTQGSLVVSAEDRETKTMAARLQIFGFLNVAEMLDDGTLRKLRPSETTTASTIRPWRLSRPSFDDTPPLAG